MQEDNHYRIRSLSEKKTEHEPDSFVQQIKLRDGLWISKLAFPSDFDSRCHYHKQPAMIDFGFILSGQLSHNYRQYATHRSIKASKGISGIGYFPGREGVMQIKKGMALNILHIHVMPEQLYQMLGRDIGALPPDFRDIVEGKTCRTYWLRNNMAPVTQAAAQEVFLGGHAGMPRNLYLEGKAMELIALQLARLAAEKPNAPFGPGLSRNEKDRIREARDLLVSDLSEPPTLHTLAHHFCLSQNKLQSGFRQLFGGSVFEYFREYKMQKARQLFTGGEMNVSQVAWEVGYTNVSQFTKAYKKRFGMLPKHFRKSVLAY